MTQELIETLCDTIAEHDSKFDIWVDYEDRSFNLVGKINNVGYVEDDYYNGTGAFVQTDVDIELKITEYNENTNNWEEIESDDVVKYFLDNYGN